MTSLINEDEMIKKQHILIQVTFNLLSLNRLTPKEYIKLCIMILFLWNFVREDGVPSVPNL